MSWGLSVTNVVADNVADELLAAKANQLEQQGRDAFDEDVERQMTTAIGAASALVQVAGEDRVNVSVGGHARRGNNDPTSLSVGIYGVPGQT